jgi:hypothetical protein
MIYTISLGIRKQDEDATLLGACSVTIPPEHESDPAWVQRQMSYQVYKKIQAMLGDPEYPAAPDSVGLS